MLELEAALRPRAFLDAWDPAAAAAAAAAVLARRTPMVSRTNSSMKPPGEPSLPNGLSDEAGRP